MLPRKQPSQKQLDWAKKVALRYHEMLSRYAYGVCRDRERAEDAVQETYVRLLQQDRRTIESRIKPWLLKVCRSRILDAARKEGRMTILDADSFERRPSEIPGPRRMVEKRDLSNVIMAHMEHLAPSQQEVLRLKFQSGLSYKEIAEVTGKSVNHVGVTLHQALKRLRALVFRSEDSICNELRK